MSQSNEPNLFGEGFSEEKPVTRQKWTHLDEAEKDQVCSLYLSGLTTTAVAKQLGIGVTTVCKTLADRNIPRRPRSQPRANRPPCKDCGVRPRYRNHSRCRACLRPIQRAVMAKRRERHIRANVCRDCGTRLNTAKFKYCVACLEHHRANTKEYKRRLKIECFNAYGGCFCQCCGETELDFLALDHINNDGAEHRKRIFGRSNAGGGHSMHQHLKNQGFPPGFQVYCHNCNWSKQISGTCVHQTSATTVLKHLSTVNLIY